MFTGLVEAQTEVLSLQPQEAGLRLRLGRVALRREPQIGASIAVSGCCLTLVAQSDVALEFDVGPETLRRTKLGTLRSGSRLNLESSLGLGDELGGHLVTGHVDGLGTLSRREQQGEWSRFYFHVPEGLHSHLAPQGSIAIDGVSLTVVEVDTQGLSVMLIPHTLGVTTLGTLQPGDVVNLETDLLAKYVARQLAFLSRGKAAPA